ncbi:MAG: hypothetical protein KIT09_35250 [Bryobacteraceae bacterium]|nr:hypothetical protein [Bryobacteraceae bacterium]
MSFRARVAAAVFLAFAAVLPAAAQPAPGGQLRLAIQAEPKSLDPLLAADEPSELVRHLTGGVLVRLNRQTQALEPELAVKWSAAAAGRKLRFELRQGVTFSDGSPFSARDVCHTFQRVMDPKIDSPASEPFRSVKGGIACSPDGNHAVNLSLGEPLAGVERLLDDIAMQSASGNARAVLGPFTVAEHRAGSHLLLTRNTNYWKKDERGVRLPYLDGIRMELQRNREFELMRFRRGELELVNNLEPELFDRLKREAPAAARDLGPSLDSEQLWFNQSPRGPLPAHKRAWFTSGEFRRAVSEAIRRADLARIVYRGHATPGVGPTSPANQFWFNAALKPPAGDPKEALARLARAGFRLEGKVLRDRGGNPVEFSVITNAGNKSRERMAALIQQDLAEIGIRVSLAPMDFPSLIERITRTFDYDACLLGLIFSDLDPMGQMSIWLSSGPQHQWNPEQKAPATEWEAEIDRLMRAQAAEPDRQKRKQAFDRVQQIVAEQAPFIYLVYRNALVAASPALGNAAPVILRPQTLWNADRLYMKAPAQVSQR